MNPEDWKRVDRVFQEAVDLPAADRTTYLDQACLDNRSLRDEVEILLHFSDASDEPIRDAVQSAVEHIRRPIHYPPGSRICQWRIERPLGQGGMGTVYLVKRDDAQF